MNNKYKQTEIGLIPSDWEVKRLGDIGFFKKGKGIRKDEVFPDGLPCIRYGELYTRHNEYVKKINSFISQNVAKESQRIAKGDILFAGSGETREEIGKCAAFLSDKETYAGGDIVILSPKNCDSLFLGFLLNDSIIAKQKAQNGQGDAVVHIYPNGLSRILLPIPPTLAEQTAIATALSDADGLITSLEKLIAKKRNIKQGAMQELLRPKEGWVVKRLGEIGEVIIGLTYKPENVSNDGVLVLRSSNIQYDQLEFIDNVYVNINVSEKLRLKENDILICVRNGSRDLIGKCALITSKVKGESFGAFMSVFRSPLNRYVIHVFRSDIVKKQIEEYLGATINQITNKSLNSFEIPFPPPNEQLAIATILSDMDTELTTLEKKLEKAKQLKQGMMQQLLTGKIRLV